MAFAVLLRLLTQPARQVVAVLGTLTSWRAGDVSRRSERLAGAAPIDLDRQLDDAKRIEVFRACMDDHGRMMYDLRVLDYDWRSVAKLMGYADAHSAEVQFGKNDRLEASERKRAQDILQKQANIARGNAEVHKTHAAELRAQLEAIQGMEGMD